jgi:hypothetical protein
MASNYQLVPSGRRHAHLMVALSKGGGYEAPMNQSFGYAGAMPAAYGGYARLIYVIDVIGLVPAKRLRLRARSL